MQEPYGKGKQGTGNRGNRGGTGDREQGTGESWAGSAVPGFAVLWACSQRWGGRFLSWKAVRKGARIARMVRAGTERTRRMIRQGSVAGGQGPGGGGQRQDGQRGNRGLGEIEKRLALTTGNS